ncbi:MAG: hypothetical protein IKB51_06880 [Clostridia bacterium]|nr:hypothetical protein [Clostridia bacterium]
MKIKLLDNGTGVIITRQPFKTKTVIPIEFEGAPENALVIFNFADGKYDNRRVKESQVSLPIDNLDGVVKLTVALTNHSITKWKCEELLITNKDNSGFATVLPNHLDLEAAFVRLVCENHEIREENAAIRQQLADMTKKFEGILEGYDII